MADYGYVRIRSWHIVAHGLLTRCGRPIGVNNPRADSLPLDEKSCETCTRLAIKDGDR